MDNPSEIEKLKKDIDMLKRKQGIEEPKEDHMGENISRLSRSINSLLKVFQEASEELKMDTHDAVLVSEKLDKLIDRIDKVEMQNEKIAKGLVAVADMIEDLQPGQRLPLSRPKPIQPPSRPMPGPSMPPESQPGPQSQSWPKQQYGMPTKPEEKKKNFLNFKM